MYAIEFESDIKDGVLKVPDVYKSLGNQHVRVVMLLDNPCEDSELRALSNHTAATIDEWRSTVEDEVWK